MGLLDDTTRVYLYGPDSKDWVDVRQLSIGELRTFRQRVYGIEPEPGEGKEEAQGYELSRLVLEACIAGWSDEAPVTPQNIARLPYKFTFKITSAAGLGGDEEAVGDGPLPVPTGLPTNASSAGSEEPQNPMSS